MAGRIQNLKPWARGVSGNPGGRPKRKPLTELYEELLDDGTTLRAIKAAILRSLRCSKTALVPLLREMADRVEGKVTQPLETVGSRFNDLTDEELTQEIQRLNGEIRASENTSSEN